MGAIRSDPIDMNIGIDNVAAMYELTENADSARLSEYRAMRQSGSGFFQQHSHGWQKRCFATICRQTG